MMKICFLIFLIMLISKSIESKCNLAKLLAQAEKICPWKDDFVNPQISEIAKIACDLVQAEHVNLDWACFYLDLTLIPVAGSVCDIVNGVIKGNVNDVGIGVTFGLLDILTLGTAHHGKSVAKRAEK